MRGWLLIGTTILLMVCGLALGFGREPAAVFINELHYDNGGGDRNEAVELAGPAGQNLSGWRLVFYNGSTGQAYFTLPLDATLVDQVNGFGTVLIPVPRNTLQNGPDGLALIDDHGEVQQFLSYEGTFPALEGPAQGLYSTDIGVVESSATGPQASLQLRGEGNVYQDFIWQAESTNSYGQPNPEQRFVPSGGGETHACGEAPLDPPLVSIPTLQGEDMRSPLEGATVSVRGVLTGQVLAKSGEVDGYFIQDPQGDGDPQSSDAMYVLTSQLLPLDHGVQLSGTVQEFYGMTALSDLTAVTDCGPGESVAVTSMRLAPHEPIDLERVEGMLVRIEGPLVIVDNDNLLRFGELGLGFSRRFIPTNFPPAEGVTLETQASEPILLIDDGSYASSPETVLTYDPQEGQHRLGNPLVSVTGLLGYGYNHFRLHPVSPPEFNLTSQREPPPAPLSPGIRVVGFNLLNYFTTPAKDTSGNSQAICGPARNADCRGPDTPAGVKRHSEKLVATLAALKADVLGLVEVENTDDTALEQLVDQLNQVPGGEGGYAWIKPPSHGDDAIRVVLLYREERMTPVGPTRVTNPSLHPDEAVFKRPALAQTFRTSTGTPFHVVVNHFKSKGSCPADAQSEDADHGQGCWNNLRKAQAQQLLAFVSRLQQETQIPHTLLIGDYNAYGGEEPIRILSDAGYVDLIAAQLPPEARYSYRHNGGLGYLDHALATTGLAEQVHRVTIWHTNTDEPVSLRYNHYAYEPRWHAVAPYGASDHDPVIVDLRELSPEPQDPIGMYYQDAEGLTGQALRTALHQIIAVQRKLNYSQIWDLLAEAHADLQQPDHLHLLYAGRLQPIERTVANFGSDLDAWNREHVWAKSHGLGSPETRGPATDAHNLWPSDVTINASRGNKDFDNGGTPHHEAPDTRSDGDSWEPRNAVKGDVARTMFYMTLRYEGDAGEPDLRLVDRTGTSGATFGKLCTLMQWHALDAVSEEEQHRNGVIQAVQGNRNPFIDRPEWVGAIWGRDCE